MANAVNRRDGKSFLDLCQEKSEMILDSQGLWKRIQEALGLRTAPEVARKLGLVKQSAYEWQKGKWPSLDTLAAIAESSNVSLHWLLTGQGTKQIYLPAVIKAPKKEVEVKLSDLIRIWERLQELDQESRQTYEQNILAIIESLEEKRDR